MISVLNTFIDILYKSYEISISQGWFGIDILHFVSGILSSNNNITIFSKKVYSKEHIVILLKSFYNLFNINWNNNIISYDFITIINLSIILKKFGDIEFIFNYLFNNNILVRNFLSFINFSYVKSWNNNNLENSFVNKFKEINTEKIIGREKEILEITSILNCSLVNFPLLIGNEGIGKKFIIYNFVRKIKENHIIFNKNIENFLLSRFI